MFPTARLFGEKGPSGNIVQFLKDNLLDKRNLPLLAMLTGLALNLTGVERPVIFTGVVRIAVYLGTLISGFAVGLLFNASRVLAYKKENLFSILYRSAFYPLFFLGAAKLFDLNRFDTLILVLFGIVPSAIYSNLIADMFTLDKNLANSVCLISTTLFLVFVLQVFLFVVSTTS